MYYSLDETFRVSRHETTTKRKKKVRPYNRLIEESLDHALFRTDLVYGTQMLTEKWGDHIIFV